MVDLIGKIGKENYGKCQLNLYIYIYVSWRRSKEGDEAESGYCDYKTRPHIMALTRFYF